MNPKLRTVGYKTICAVAGGIAGMLAMQALSGSLIGSVTVLVFTTYMFVELSL